ncbi:MAG: PaaI family thioesterase [Deltaproteobacteria bacterium]|nr:MAG: PaaI family thioesterase [Deltaproteobacteria bacterium]
MADESSRRFTHWEASHVEVTGALAEHRRLAAAMRVVIERLVLSDAPEAELRAAADALERYAERLATHPRRDRMEGFSETAPAGDATAFFDHSPLIGRANPLAPPIRLEAQGDRALGTVVFGSAYEGPPGCVHGGFVAAAFDELLGFAQTLTGSPGMTGTLTIRYRQPTPLHTPLQFEAHVARIEGRKNFIEGRLHAGERLCAEADGIFITIDQARFRKLLASRVLPPESR